MLMTRVASVQLALLKTRATHGSSGVVTRDRSATAKPFIAGVHPSAWTAHQALRQKRIRSRSPLEMPEERIGEQHNCANHREGKLEPSGKEFVRVPAENEKRRSREAVWQKYSSFEE